MTALPGAGGITAAWNMRVATPTAWPRRWRGCGGERGH